MIFVAVVIGCVVGHFIGKRIWVGVVSTVLLAIIGFIGLSTVHNAASANAELVAQNNYQLKPLSSLNETAARDYYVVYDELNGELVINFVTTQTDGVNIWEVPGR